MKRLVPISAMALAALLWASSASALSYSISASLDGAQETPPVATPGTGTMTGTYDDATNFLTWSGTFSGLVGATTAAHFHGPAAVGVGPAAILVSMMVGDIFPVGVMAGAFSGDATLSALDETRLLAGLLYANIHSTFRTGGEIRGQVYATLLPEPTTLGLLALGLAGLALASRRRSA